MEKKILINTFILKRKTKRTILTNTEIIDLNKKKDIKKNKKLKSNNTKNWTIDEWKEWEKMAEMEMKNIVRNPQIMTEWP